MGGCASSDGAAETPTPSSRTPPSSLSAAGTPGAAATMPKTSAPEGTPSDPNNPKKQRQQQEPPNGMSYPGAVPLESNGVSPEPRRFLRFVVVFSRYVFLYLQLRSEMAAQFRARTACNWAGSSRATLVTFGLVLSSRTKDITQIQHSSNPLSLLALACRPP